jgi:galactonate dehydratase
VKIDHVETVLAGNWMYFRSDTRFLFLEDPVPPESPVLSGELARRVTLPIATGERLHNLEELRDLLAGGPVGYIRPDLGLRGLT